MATARIIYNFERTTFSKMRNIVCFLFFEKYQIVSNKGTETMSAMMATATATATVTLT